MTYTTVFFDAGETLVHPHPSFHELFAEVCLSAGYPVDPDEVHASSGVVTDRFAQAARDKEMWTTSPERSRKFWLSVYETYLDELAVSNGDGLDERLYATFSDMANYRVFTDVMPTLRALNASGFTMGVISNFEAWLDGLLEMLGVTEFLPVRVISGIEGIEKPDPSLFTIALERAGVAADQCVYVGDNPVFDVAPAAELGMFPVLIDRRNRHEAHTGVRITSMEQLPGVLAL